MIYKDIVMKAEFYKEYLIQTIIKNGGKLNSELIKERLNRIDMNLSIYKETDVKPNETFDTEKFNTDMIKVYKDLFILYRLLFESSIYDYNNLYLFAESYINELSSKADQCKTNVDLKTSITALGKTLAIVTNKTMTDSMLKDGMYKIDMGSITTRAGKEVCCIIDGSHLDITSIIFEFTDDNGNITNCSPYTYNRDTISVPGSINTKTYNASINSKENTINEILMSIKDFTPDTNNDYIIYAGKDKIKLIDNVTAEKSFIDYTNTLDTMLLNSGRYSFYVYNNNSDANKNMSFYSSNPFSWSNFDQNDKSSLNKKDIISFDCAARTIVNFSTNGKIFADRVTGTVSGNNLYYPANTKLTDFYVVEYMPGEEKKYSVSLLIEPKSDTTQSVNYAAIKELKK